MLFRQRWVSILTLMLILTAFIFTMNNQVMAADRITLGSEGQGVKALQLALNNQDYWCGDANGIYGPRTFNSLIRYQRDHQMVINGKVNEELKEALGMLQEVNEQVFPSNPQPTASTANTGQEVTPTVSRGARQEEQIITMVATGYTAAAEENWPYAGAPSYIGLPLARGIVAVDPDVIPMGSKLYIEGYGEAIAADQGGAIQGNRIDLFFDSKQEAFDWGMRSIKVTIYQ